MGEFRLVEMRERRTSVKVLQRSDLLQFEELGYVVVEGIFDPEADFQPVVEEYDGLLDTLAARWVDAGHLSSSYRGLPFEERLLRIIADSGPAYSPQYLDISLPQDVITEETPSHHGPAVFNLLRTPRLLDAVEDLIGPEIYSNPVQHVRIKPPEHLIPSEKRHPLSTRTQWHQDLGVVDPEADDANILTVWFPLTEATVENGCLLVEPRSHKGELVAHCTLDEYKGLFGIPERYLGPEQVPLPMKPGDVLFMHKKTKHASLPNVSDAIRWSFDLRYQPIGEPTGRPWFPGFVARSRAHPEWELTDPAAWAQLWRDARTALASSQNPKFNRWKEDDPRCA